MIIWNHLFHAYGIATDTPKHIENLTSGDAELCSSAIGHLFGAVIHQNTVYTVTPVVIKLILSKLNSPLLRMKYSEDNNSTVLSSLVSFLYYAAESVSSPEEKCSASMPSEGKLKEFYALLGKNSEDEENLEYIESEIINDLMELAYFDIRSMVSEVLPIISPFTADPEIDIRSAAVAAVGKWGCLQKDGEQTQAALLLIRDKLLKIEKSIANRDERAALLLTLGELGDDVTEFLADIDKAVSACAAMFVQGRRAESILVEALSKPLEIDYWFNNRPDYFEFKTRYSFLKSLLQRDVSIEQALPALIAIIKVTSGGLGANFEWGDILKLAFPPPPGYEFKPGVFPPLPDRLSEAQAMILEALLENDELWAPSDGNASLARKWVGLTKDRKETADYLKIARP